MIRPLHPIDMPSYLAFARNAHHGDGLEDCGDGPLSHRFLDFLGRSLPLDRPRQTWIYTEQHTIVGMVAVRRRRGTAVWEIDRLAGLDSPRAEVALESLLDHLAALGGEEGVQKIFLRLPTASPLLPIARRAGFVVYASERIWRGDPRPRPELDVRVALRPRRGMDHQALFEHYVRAVPARTRQAEGMTLQEWRWLDGWQPRRHWRFDLRRSRQDLVLESAGRVLAWVSVEPLRRVMRLSLDPQLLRGSQVDGILANALLNLPVDGAVSCPAREYQAELEAALSRLGFVPTAERALMVRHLTVRVGDRCLVPVGA